MSNITLPDIIRKKRDGLPLSDKDIKYFVESAYNGNADPSQIGAMLMAMYKSDLSDQETSCLTTCMINSGNTLNWPGIVVDKHSTGGVGDKVSIALVPALAALGFTVPMISGRGLSWTGGTLDKLESIPGFRVELSQADMSRSLEQCSSFIAATTKDICPADKILYKIRDITSTVDNYSLITGSILSKKIAAGVKFLVLDIKVGEGAFMKNVENAEELGRKMISVSKQFNVNTRALLTRMDTPIGMTVGNSLEIEESIDVLLRKGPNDLLELITHLGGELLVMTGKASSPEIGQKRISEVIADGSAMDSFLNMLLSQGVSSDVVTKLGKGDYSPLPKSRFTTKIESKSKGYVQAIDALTVAKISWLLGAGRSKPEDIIDLSVGIRLHKEVGNYVEVEELLMTVYHNKPMNQKFIDDLINSFTFTDQKVNKKSMVIKCLH